MPEPQTLATPAAPAAQPVVTQTPAAPEPDLMSKINQFRKSSTTIAAPSTENSEVDFDFKEIESIADPKAKEAAMKAYKSIQSGFTKKFQEVAALRKDLESRVNQPENWTPDRIQQLLNNPQFVQAASQIVPQQNPPNSGLTDQEYSALTETEKAELTSLKSEISNLKQVNFQALIAQQDAQLKSKHDDYDAQMVSNAIRDLAQLPPTEIREHVFKSIMHDKHMQEAYELGKQEASNLNQQKANAISTTGFSTTSSSDVPKREEKESPQNYFERLAHLARNRLAQNGNGQIRK